MGWAWFRVRRAAAKSTSALGMEGPGAAAALMVVLEHRRTVSAAVGGCGAAGRFLGATCCGEERRSPGGWALWPLRDAYERLWTFTGMGASEVS